MNLTSLDILWICVQVVIGYNLVLPFLYFIVFKLRPKKTFAVKRSSEPDYAIIVTAYQFINTIPAAVASILKMNYSNYIVYVVADKCDISNLKFDDERIVVLRPEEALNSNTRSHLYAIQHFRRNHEYVTIVDSDNLVTPGYLTELNKLFDAGFTAVQGVRKAKNLDTTIACLDAVQDIYYHLYDREVAFHLGSSASLAGSGMAFKANFYKEWLEENDISGAGFDKVLQYDLVSSKQQIAFSKQAIVFDEKTSRSDQLVKQRARWINTWFRFYKLGFKLLAKGITALNWNQVSFSLMLLRPPLFMLFLLTGAFTLVNLFTNLTYFFVWLAAICVFAVGFFIALVHSNADKKIYASLVSIPKFIFYQVLSLFKARKANKISVATQHYHAHQLEDIAVNGSNLNRER
jgi:cellulose synthase/poly-beta-1,6-N-acetylglucosamine synthase-like glycosyltransferase